MKDRYRIVEFRIRKGDAEVWFYPEVLMHVETTGMLWWKKVVCEHWYRVFDINDIPTPQNGIDIDLMTQKEREESEVVFKTLEEAKQWLSSRIGTDGFNASSLMFTQNYLQNAIIHEIKFAHDEDKI